MSEQIQQQLETLATLIRDVQQQSDAKHELLLKRMRVISNEQKEEHNVNDNDTENTSTTLFNTTDNAPAGGDTDGVSRHSSDSRGQSVQQPETRSVQQNWFDRNLKLPKWDSTPETLTHFFHKSKALLAAKDVQVFMIWNTVQADARHDAPYVATTPTAASLRLYNYLLEALPQHKTAHFDHANMDGGAELHKFLVSTGKPSMQVLAELFIKYGQQLQQRDDESAVAYASRAQTMFANLTEMATSTNGTPPIYVSEHMHYFVVLLSVKQAWKQYVDIQAVGDNPKLINLTAHLQGIERRATSQRWNQAMYSNSTQKRNAKKKSSNGRSKDDNKKCCYKKDHHWSKCQMICHICSNKGHISPFCPNKTKVETANAVQATAAQEEIVVTSFTSVVDSDGEWYVDTAASAHMGHCNVDNPVTPRVPVRIQLSDGTRTTALYQGNVGGMKPVYQVPSFRVNLVSVPVLVKQGYQVLFNDTGAYSITPIQAQALTLSNRLALFKDNMFVFDKHFDFDNKESDITHSHAVSTTNTETTVTASSPADGKSSHEKSAPMDAISKLWHRRLAHVSLKRLVKPAKMGIIRGLPKKLSTDHTTRTCGLCTATKMVKFPHANTVERCERPLQRIYTDIAGPITPPTRSGMKYYVVFIDDYTRRKYPYALANKSGMLEAFKLFRVAAETDLARSIQDYRLEAVCLRCVRSDNGGVFTAAVFQQYLTQHNIRAERTVPYSSPSNGVAERGLQTLSHMTAAMVMQANLPEYWEFALKAAAFLDAILPTSSNSAHDNAPPMVMWHKKPVNYAMIRTWGCLCYVHLQPGKERLIGAKMGPVSAPAIFLGYSEESKGFLVLKDNAVIVRRSVIFHEDIFPGRGHACPHNGLVLDHLRGGYKPLGQKPPSIKLLDIPHLRASSDELNTQLAVPATLMQGDQKMVPDVATVHEDADVKLTPVVAEVVNEHTGTVEEKANYINLDAPLESKEDAETRLFVTKQASKEFAFTSSIASAKVTPTTLHQAKTLPEAKEWIQAFNSEIQSFRDNKVFEVVKRSEVHSSKRILPCIPLFKIKHDQFGNVAKYKVRIVVKGDLQEESRGDFYETFSPVLRHETIRAFLATAAEKDWDLYHFDVKTAFLQGDLEEDIYVYPPEGMDVPPGTVLKLLKAVYGLKQAPRCWNSKIDKTLLSMGFQRSKDDPCLYVRLKDGKKVALWVDDGILSAPKGMNITPIINHLKKFIDIGSIGPLEYFVGYEITRNREAKTITLTQKRTTLDMINRFGLSECNPVSTPGTTNFAKEIYTGELVTDKKEKSKYRSMVCSLIWLNITTRIDISHCTSALSRILDKPRRASIKAAKRIFRYLKGTYTKGITFGGKIHGLKAAVDASWDSDVLESKSYTGYVLLLNGGPIAWKSKLQPIQALSSAEAEYIAYSQVMAEVLWLRRITSSLGIPLQNPTMIATDSNSALKLTVNPAYHARTKHIARHYHVVRLHVQGKRICFFWVPTKDNVADLLTKSLPKQQHYLHTNSLMGE